jgi:hypothetical protein
MRAQPPASSERARSRSSGRKRCWAALLAAGPQPPDSGGLPCASRTISGSRFLARLAMVCTPGGAHRINIHIEQKTEVVIIFPIPCQPLNKARVTKSRQSLWQRKRLYLDGLLALYIYLQ